MIPGHYHYHLLLQPLLYPFLNYHVLYEYDEFAPKYDAKMYKIIESKECIAKIHYIKQNLPYHDEHFHDVA